MSRNHVSTLLPYRVYRLLLTLVAMTFAIAFAFAHSAAETGRLNDGLTDQERAEVYNQIAASGMTDQGYRGLIIVDSTRPIAYFGMYQFSQMTQPGWTLFENTIDWAISNQSHATARIWLATYNGTLDPEKPMERNGIAVYNYLIDSMGVLSGNIHVAHQTSLVTGDFTGYDLVIYANPYARSTANVVSQNMPYITTSPGQTDELGIGAGEWILHENRDFVFVLDTTHDITSGFDTGQLVLQDQMWMDAVFSSGNGVPLVTADEGLYFTPLFVRIEAPNTTVYSGGFQTISLYQEAVPSWFEMGGFDFLLTYDPTVLTVIAVDPGGLLDSCQWEYFTYQLGSSASCGGSACPDGTLRIIGVADLSGTPGSPSCFAGMPGSLADIEFQVASDTSSGFSFVPVDFIWYDCGDNAVSSLIGDTLFVSRDVRTADASIITKDTTFPTPFGAPSECLGGAVPAIRRINYRNGGVFVVGGPPIPVKGDVNLNGLSYEIADAILFANYFVYGLDLFQVDMDKQIEATEVNNDSIPLTLDDYVYLWRVIIGDANPLPSPPMAGDTVLFVQDTVNKKVSLSYPDSLSAIYLVFEGDLMPWGWSNSTRPFDGQFTRVLMDVFLFQNSTIFSHDSLFYYTGTGNLVGAYAAFDGLTPLPTAIAGGVNSCCVRRGNVDGDPQGSVDIVDLTELVAYVYGNGPAPACLVEADISGDFLIDLLDMVFFVDYLFQSGPPPPDCP